MAWASGQEDVLSVEEEDTSQGSAGTLIGLDHHHIKIQ